MDFSEINNIPNVLLGYLRGKIISGDLPAGQKIHENELATSLKLSRGPIREAFRILEQEHLVVNVPRRGTFVTRLSYADLDEVYQARQMIEFAAIDLLEAKGIAELPSAADALREAQELAAPSRSTQDDFLVYREKITDFHTGLVMEAKNSRLSHYYQTLYFSLARYQYLHIRLNIPGSFERTMQDHYSTLEMINARRYSDAKVFLLKHLRYAQESQRDALRTQYREGEVK